MDKTYTSGQVSGMTGIPIRTIQDYVSDFRDTFSELAQKGNKSRRFNDQDIKNLLTIKRARSQRLTDEEVRQILNGEIILPLANEYNEDDIKQMVIKANERLSKAIELEKNIQNQANNLSRMIWSIDRLVKTLNDNVSKLLDWRMYMYSLNEVYNQELQATKKVERELQREQERQEKKIKQEKRGNWFHELLHPEEQLLNMQQQPPRQDEIDYRD